MALLVGMATNGAHAEPRSWGRLGLSTSAFSAMLEGRTPDGNPVYVALFAAGGPGYAGPGDPTADVPDLTDVAGGGRLIECDESLVCSPLHFATSAITVSADGAGMLDATTADGTSLHVSWTPVNAVKYGLPLDDSGWCTFGSLESFWRSIGKHSWEPNTGTWTAEGTFQVEATGSLGSQPLVSANRYLMPEGRLLTTCTHSMTNAVTDLSISY